MRLRSDYRSLHRILSVTLAVLLFAPMILSAQLMQVFNLDTRFYPQIEADLILVGADGKRITSLSPGDFTIRENGDTMEVISVQCPVSKPPEPLSILFLIDISESMRTEVSPGVSRFDNVRQAVLDLIDELDFAQTECAVISFNSRSFINQSFTRSPILLRTAVENLQADGGTDYREALLGQPGGGLNAIAGGGKKRVVIMLTDGEGNANSDEIVRRAKEQSTLLYTIAVGLPAPQILKTIAEQTGGLWFESLDTREMIRDIYRMINLHAAGEEPCHIVWRSVRDCIPLRHVDIGYHPLRLHHQLQFTGPPNGRGISVVPSSLRFGPVPPGETRTLPFVLWGRSDSTILHSILPVDGPFSIVELEGGNTPFPVRLDSGAYIRLNVRFSPTDSSISTAAFTINSSVCPDPVLYASGGWGDQTLPHLKLVAPDGGEEFVVGSDTMITWTGLLPDDPVMLEYSTDAGTTWRNVAPLTDGLLHQWHVPNTPSSTCLARVTEIQVDRPLLVMPHDNRVMAVRYFNDGKHILTLTTSGELFIWNAESGDFVDRLGGSGYGDRLELSPDNRYAAVGGTIDGIINLLNLQDRTVQFVRNSARFSGFHPLFYPTGQVMCFTPDGGFLTNEVDPGAPGGNRVIGLKRVDLNGGRDTIIMNDSRGFYEVACYSPSGNRLVVAGEGGITQVWNGTADTLRAEMIDPHGTVVRLLFSPDGTRLYTLTSPYRSGASPTPYLTVWNLATYQPITSYPLDPSVSDADVALLTDHFAIAADNLSMIEQVAGTVDRRFAGHTGSVHSVRFSPDGTRILSGSADSTAIIWQVSLRPSLVDVSDSLWSIVAPELKTYDVDFGTVQPGSSNDTLLTAYLSNVGTIPAHVSRILLTGVNRNDFRVISGGAPFELQPGENRLLELSFTPAFAGGRSATLSFVSQSDTIRSQLTGIGIDPVFSFSDLVGDRIDFGAVRLQTLRDSIAFGLNIGSQPLVVDSIRMIGPDMKTFTFSTPSVPRPLQPGDSIPVALTFRPELIGLVHTYLEVSYNQPGSPAYIQLIGRGVDYAVPVIEVPAVLEWNSGPCRIDSTPRTIVIHNIGDTTLRIDSIHFATSTDRFSLDSGGESFPIFFPAGESRSMSVQFHPELNGQDEATINVYSDGVNGSPASISLNVSTSSFRMIPITDTGEVVDLGRLCSNSTAGFEVRVASEGTTPGYVMISSESQSGISVTRLSDATVVMSEHDTLAITGQIETGEVDGPFEVTIAVTDTVCGASLRYTFRGEVSRPDVTILMEDPGCAEDSIVMKGSGAGSYRWLIGDSVICDDCSELSVPNIQSTQVRLEGTTAEGCVGTDSVVLTGPKPKEIVRAAFVRTLRSRPGETVMIGIQNLDPFPSDGDLRDLQIRFEFDPSILQIDPSSVAELLNQTILANWSIEGIQTGPGMIVIDLAIDHHPYLNRTGLLLLMRGTSYLSSSIGTDLNLSISSSTCVEVQAQPGYLTLDSICGLSARLFEYGFGKYSLSGPTPNPVHRRDFGFDFSLGLDGETTVILARPDGRQETLLERVYLMAGEYHLEPGSGSLPAGTYYVLLKSAEWSASQQVRIID